MKRFIAIAAVAAAMFTAGSAVTPAVADAATTCSQWEQREATWIYWCTNVTTTGWTIVDYYYWNGRDPVRYGICYWRTGWISSSPSCVSV
jgi:hypothetical protein